MIKTTKEKLKHHFHEVMRTKISPESIALGFAVGTFIGILPTPGFSILLGLLIVLIFKQVNKFALFVAMAFWNPLFLIPIYWLSNEIGTLLFGAAPVVKYDVAILNNIYNFTRRFLVGNLIITTIISTASYFIVKRLVVRYRERDREKKRDKD